MYYQPFDRSKGLWIINEFLNKLRFFSRCSKSHSLPGSIRHAYFVFFFILPLKSILASYLYKVLLDLRILALYDNMYLLIQLLWLSRHGSIFQWAHWCTVKLIQLIRGFTSDSLITRSHRLVSLNVLDRVSILFLIKFMNSLIDWWLSDWLIDWLIDVLIDWILDWFCSWLELKLLFFYFLTLISIWNNQEAMVFIQLT